MHECNIRNTHSTKTQDALEKWDITEAGETGNKKVKQTTKQTLNRQRIQGSNKEAWKNPNGNNLSINDDLKAFNFELGQSEKDYDQARKGEQFQKCDNSITGALQYDLW